MEHSAFPSDETLAAFIDGRLDEETRKRVVAHVADCEDCYGTLMASREWAETEPRPLVISQSRSLRGLSIGGSVAAAAAVVLVFLTTPVREQWREYRYERSTGIRELVNAANKEKYRIAVVRVVGGFDYKAVRPVERGGGSTDTNWRLQGAAADIQDRALREPTPEYIHALGDAYLLNGDPEKAIDRFDAALLQSTGLQHTSSAIRVSRNASLLSDYAAACYIKGISRGDSAALATARELVEQAWVIAKTPTIAWNRAVIRDAQGLTADATVAWRDYLTLDPHSKWSVEAIQRMRGHG